MPACRRMVSMGACLVGRRGLIEAEFSILDFPTRLEEFGEPDAKDVGGGIGGGRHGEVVGGDLLLVRHV